MRDFVAELPLDLGSRAVHGRKFDLSTGAALSDGCGVATFPVRVTDTGLIMVDVEPVATLSVQAPFSFGRLP